MAFEIWTIEDLLDLKNHKNDRCVLMANIDASEDLLGNDINWEPVGTTVAPFVGSLIGNGYTISKLTLTTSAYEYPSFMGRCDTKGILTTNGTFTGNATGWTLGTGWAYNSNNVIKNADGTGLLAQASGDMVQSLVVGERYFLTYTISGHTVGSVTPSCGGVELTGRTGNGTYTQEFTAISTADLEFLPSDTSRFTIDNVILLRVHVYEDVNLRNADITNEALNGRTAIFAALMTAGSTLAGNRPKISRCRVHGKVTRPNDSTGGSAHRTGGFVGESNYCDFDDCHSDIQMSVTAKITSRGGFTGGSTQNQETFTDCSASGVITCSGTVTHSVNDTFSTYTGGFGQGVCTRCKSSVTIIDSATLTGGAFSQIGGFCAAGSTGTSLCYATGNIIRLGSGPVRIGGFVGEVANSQSKCFATGSITCKNPVGTSYIGGFVGFNLSGLTNCYSRGDVCKTGASGTGVNIGGFAGYSNATLTNCYSTGFVGGTAQNTGGFIGQRGATGNDNTCYWDTETSGKTNAAGTGTSTATGKTTLEMKTEATFVSWDFATIWEITTYLRSAVAGANVTVWLSKTGDYDNFADGVKENDSFSLVIPSTNEIRWLGALEALLLGTAGDEWRISSNRLDTALSPTNFKVAQQSEHGSSRIQPVKINSSLMFVDFVARKLREMTFVDPKYEAPDLTALAEHITLNGITTIARQKNPDSIIWITLGNGDLISMTYEREQDVVAWSKHPLGGDGFAQSVCVIPGATADIIYLTVKRTIDSVEKVYIEKMAPRTFSTKADAFFVDCGITVSVSDSVSVTGISHLIGEKVAVVVDGVVIYDGTEAGSVVSASGVVTLPAKITSTKVHVGLPYSAVLKPMRLVLGDSMGSLTRINEIVVSFLNSMGVKYGNSLNDLYNIDFTDARWTNTADITGLFTGEVVVSMPGKIDPLNPIYIVSDQPTPCVPRCIVARADRTGR